MLVRFVALLIGVSTHATFLAAVIVMMISLFGGMGFASGNLSGFQAAGWDLLLVLQFPIGHSFLLSKKGRRVLALIFPGELGKNLVTTTFVWTAALQSLILFCLWSPIGTAKWHAHGLPLVGWSIVYVISWLFLGVSMINAGLPIQTGFLGWWSIFRNREPYYSPFPTHGLYSICRHPVYLAMALVACSGPVWNVDHAIIAVIFTAYCIFGPRAKERRYFKRYGDTFAAYTEQVPFFPTVRSIRGALWGSGENRTLSSLPRQAHS